MSAENLDALAALIRRERDALLAEWRHEVRQLSVAHNLDVPTLNDHIPDLLDGQGSTFRFTIPDTAGVG